MPRGQLRILIARIEVPLVHLPQRIQQIALLLLLHAGGTAEIEDRIPARPERRPLIGRRKKPLPVHRRTGPDAAFEQHHETRQVLVLAAEAVQNPRAEARPADARPAVVDQELRLRVREALVIAGADHGEIVGSLRNVRKQIRHFEAGLRHTS